MSLFRTDLQMALNDLHVALLESADYYRDAASFLQGEAHQGLRELLQYLCEERSALAGRVEAAIRQSGDLPSVPDADRETGGEWLQRLQAVLDEDQAEHILVQRLEAEEHLREELGSYTMAPVRQSYHGVYQQVTRHVQSARERLQALRGKGI